MAKKQLLEITLENLQLYAKCVYEAGRSKVENTDIDRLTRDIVCCELLLDVLGQSGHAKDAKKVTDKYPGLATYLDILRKKISKMNEDIRGF